MKVSSKGLDFIMWHEGCVLKAYPDPGTGGEPWTIGYGHTAGVKPGDTCTKEQAAEWLRDDVAWVNDTLTETVRVPLNQNQIDALGDFIFNIGRPQWEGSTLLKLLNNGEYQVAADQFARWNKPPLPGIIQRRKDERALFLA
jgi:lysozyme